MASPRVFASRTSHGLLFLRQRQKQIPNIRNPKCKANWCQPLHKSGSCSALFRAGFSQQSERRGRCGNPHAPDWLANRTGLMAKWEWEGSWLWKWAGMLIRVRCWTCPPTTFEMVPYKIHSQMGVARQATLKSGWFRFVFLTKALRLLWRSSEDLRKMCVKTSVSFWAQHETKVHHKDNHSSGS